MPPLSQFTPDINTRLKAPGLVAASASMGTIVRLGGPTQRGRILVDMHLDVTALEVDSGDELYALHFQVSNSETFASGIFSTFIVELGDAAVLTGGQDVDSPLGHYVFPVTNDHGGVLYEYCRGFTVVSGTIATGINFQAWLAERH